MATRTGSNTRDRFLVRHAATSLRGSLIEFLAVFRPNGEARVLEDDVRVTRTCSRIRTVNSGKHSPTSSPTVNSPS